MADASGGHGEIFVPSVNTKQHGWQYDFLWGEFFSTQTAWGPIGVLYEFL